MQRLAIPPAFRPIIDTGLDIIFTVDERTQSLDSFEAKNSLYLRDQVSALNLINQLSVEMQCPQVAATAEAIIKAHSEQKDCLGLKSMFSLKLTGAKPENVKIYFDTSGLKPFNFWALFNTACRELGLLLSSEQEDIVTEWQSGIVRPSLMGLQIGKKPRLKIYYDPSDPSDSSKRNLPRYDFLMQKLGIMDPTAVSQWRDVALDLGENNNTLMKLYYRNASYDPANAPYLDDAYITYTPQNNYLSQASFDARNKLLSTKGYYVIGRQ